MRLLLVVVVLCAGCAAAPEARYEEYRDRIEREAAALLAARPANAPLEVTYDELTEIATRGGALGAAARDLEQLDPPPGPQAECQAELVRLTSQAAEMAQVVAVSGAPVMDELDAALRPC